MDKTDSQRRKDDFLSLKHGAGKNIAFNETSTLDYTRPYEIDRDSDDLLFPSMSPKRSSF
jgi:hypothetical protein